MDNGKVLESFTYLFKQESITIKAHFKCNFYFCEEIRYFLK